jgi:adenosylcobinamide-GDP ribazoletransferase
VWWAGDEIWAPIVAASLAVAADLALTGMLHVDGVGDTADGLLPPLDRDRRLEVMADPRAGAFGVSAIVIVLVVRVAALASVAPAVWAVAGIWCASRTAMAVATRTMTYVRPGGLASAFVGGSPRFVGAYGVTMAVALAVVDAQLQGAVAVVATVLGATAVLAFARHRIGGFTGDVLGACGVLGETAGLLVLAAAW